MGALSLRKGTSEGSLEGIVVQSTLGFTTRGLAVDLASSDLATGVLKAENCIIHRLLLKLKIKTVHEKKSAKFCSNRRFFYLEI